MVQASNIHSQRNYQPSHYHMGVSSGAAPQNGISSFLRAPDGRLINNPAEQYAMSAAVGVGVAAAS